jgi:hypothetical protein
MMADTAAGNLVLLNLWLKSKNGRNRQRKTLSYVFDHVACVGLSR